MIKRERKTQTRVFVVRPSSKKNQDIKVKTITPIENWRSLTFQLLSHKSYPSLAASTKPKETIIPITTVVKNELFLNQS